MKRVLAVLTAGFLLALLAVPALAADEVFSGVLRGSNEVPAVTTNGAGAAYVFINEAETEVKYAVSYTGLSGPIIAGHIHVGATGVNGPIMLPLDIGPSTMFGTLTQADFQASSAAPNWGAALTAIRQGKAYVNLHTAAHPGGEVRAQLAAAANPTAAPTASAAATAKPTTQPTTRPSATPAQTGGAGASEDTGSPPPTSTLPASGRGMFGDFLAIMVVLAAAGTAGAVAVWKLQPPRRRRDDWD